MYELDAVTKRFENLDLGKHNLSEWLKEYKRLYKGDLGYLKSKLRNESEVELTLYRFLDSSQACTFFIFNDIVYYINDCERCH